MMREEKMNKLAEEVNEHLKDLGTEVSVRYINVFKNNAYLDGLSIKNGEEALSPTIYLTRDLNEKLREESDFFDQETGLTWNTKSLADYIIDLLRNLPKHEGFDATKVVNKDYVLNHIKPRIYGYSDMNLQGLKEADRLYYTEKHLSLIVAFTVDVSEMMDGIATVGFTNALFERLKLEGVTMEDIEENAFENLRSEAEFKGMTETLMEMMGSNEVSDLIGSIPEDEKMYVLSTRNRTHGAALILDDVILTNIRNRIKSDYFIIPSSVHEILVVKDDGSMGYVELLKMVKEVNSTQVSDEDRLVDAVYHYSPDHVKNLEMYAGKEEIG